VTRQKYQKRLEKFFDFLGLEGATVEDLSKEYKQNLIFRFAIGFTFK